MLKVDLSNPGNRVETTVANESAKGQSFWSMRPSV